MSIEDEIEERKRRGGPGAAGPLNPLKVPEVRIECSVPRIVYERNEYVKGL